MTDYAEVPTDVLKNYIRHSRGMVAEWSHSRDRAQRSLRTAQASLEIWTEDRDAQEAELRSREPEFGGTYQHPDGFAYQSFRGRSMWEYRIMHTPVSVLDAGTYDGYANYQPSCSEHGSLGLAGTNLEMMLALAFRHVQDVHL